MKQYPMNRIAKKAVQGATLLEVLISVFLLTFGILGLMAAQLRSVSAVSESENRAIAAQAAENLAEAMQANPDLTADSKREYTRYIKNVWTDVTAPDSCTTESATKPTADSKNACALGTNPISKQELALAQLGEFQYILRQMPNTVDLKYAICLDDTSTLAAEAQAPSTTSTQCKNSGQAVIKVLWSTRNTTEETTTGIPGTTNQLYYLVLPE